VDLDLSVPELCGQLLVGGFAGTELPADYAAEVRRGHRAGAILFRRNVGDLPQVAALCRALAAATPESTPALVAIDQEGGRVSRLPEPFLRLPPMRRLGELGDLELTTAAAACVGRQLRTLGINMNFAPVMDVDSNPDNPVIGDRAFGRDPRTVMQHGVAFIRGLGSERVLACAKHFPGHGDTSVDSHIELPRVTHDRERLMQVEVPPFRAASGAGVAAMMTAHVVYDALDDGVAATASRAICASLLRREIGFEGVLFSDDLEMGAIAKHHSMAEAAVQAVEAGCDVLLVCSGMAAQNEAHEALVKRAERDERFRDRCREAATRSLKIRTLCPPRPAVNRTEIERVMTATNAVQLRARLDSEAPAGATNMNELDPTERA